MNNCYVSIQLVVYNFIGLYHCTGHYPSLYRPLPLPVPAITLVQACMYPCPGLYPVPLPACTRLYPCTSLYPLYSPVHPPPPPPPPPRQYRPVPLSRLVSMYPSLNMPASLSRPVPLFMEGYMPASLSRPVPLREQRYRPIPLPVPFYRIVLLYMYSSCLYSKHGFITGPLL